MGLDLVVAARRVVSGSGEAALRVGVRAGVVEAVVPFDAPLAGAERAELVELADDEVLMPGVVDSHVHVNDPGREEWEGFTSATRAALAGGVTTLVDMPLNSIPPTVDVDALAVKREAARGRCFVDVGFWGGAVPGNLVSLRPLHDAGVLGFKCFLLPSGVDEFPPLDDRELDAAMREIASFDGLLLVHAEDEHTVGAAPACSGGRYADFLASRPRAAENVAVERVVSLALATGCRVHVLHVSSADVLPLLAEARAAGVRVTAETCPHYLTFTAEEVPDGATAYKCCPPIREEANRERLWEGLRDGVLDLVVSDHSPSTVDLKCLDTGDFGAAWGGVASLQLALPAVWTGARARGLALSEVVRWMCERPADLAGLASKGRISVGADADLCVLAPEEEQVVDVRRLHHRNPLTPYDRRRLAGVVRGTWLRGVRADVDGAPRGRLLRGREAGARSGG
jgi:allantoinase